jgi:hypothetical protein
VSPFGEGRGLPGPKDAASTSGYFAAASFGQQRLWMVDQLLSDKSAYNDPRAVRLTGPLDVRALEAALCEIVRRHDVLRTSFALVDGELRQVVAPASAQVLQVEDLSGLAANEREACARRLAKAEAALPFDLARGPLIRIRVLRLAVEEHWLLVTQHHVITDRWSAAVFARELSRLYVAFSRGEDSPLRELPVQYADYADWQRELLAGEKLEGLLSYWATALAELPVLDLPTDRPRPPVASFEGERVEFKIAQELAQGLKALGHRQKATLFMTLLAAFHVLLHRLTGQEDIAVGVPIAGRNRLELEELIGFFVNSLVLRGDLRGDPSFRAYLARVRSVALDAYAHAELPFEKLVERLAPSRDLSSNPLFGVAFQLANTPPIELELMGLVAQRVEGVSPETAKFDLMLAMNETADGLLARWEYSTDLFDAATIERMAGHFETLLGGIVADAEQCIGQLPLLNAAERRRLLVQWNDTAIDYPRDRCIHQLFEAQVARTPGAVAVVFEDEALTYAELNARANQLARHLIALGAGAETLVGICMERSLEMVVGLLGILKAGGAYVPLDPTYPQQRLAFMLEDTAGADPAHAAAAARSTAAVSRTRSVPGPGRARHRRARQRRPRHRDHCRVARVRHLYLRLHGQTEGCDDRTSQPRQLRSLARVELSAGADGSRAPEHVDRLRYLDPRGVLAAVRRRPARTGSARGAAVGGGVDRARTAQRDYGPSGRAQHAGRHRRGTRHCRDRVPASGFHGG